MSPDYRKSIICLIQGSVIVQETGIDRRGASCLFLEERQFDDEEGTASNVVEPSSLKRWTNGYW
jgi:hypothetical protein